jgi:hypothetical protein
MRYSLGTLVILTITSLKMAFGLATINYIRAVICSTLSLLVLLAPEFLWHLSTYGRLPPLSF